ncbi:MAG: hypothetical protein JSS11_02120 [Verrucomicrobia bacterium]|nr:hypothetical protein [Verrucomicrobiota bacterium]
MSRTYCAAEERGKARASLIWGIVSTGALIALSFVLPDRTPRIILPLGIALGLEQIAKYLQTPAIARCEAGGMAKGSWWMVVGVGLLSFLVIFSILCGVVYLFSLE